MSVKAQTDLAQLTEKHFLKTTALIFECSVRIYGDIVNEDAYVCITDIAKFKNPEDPRVIVTNWMSSYSTADYLAVWEEIHNPNFIRLEFQSVRNERGRFIMTPKQWIEIMNGIGIISKAGRYSVYEIRDLTPCHTCYYFLLTYIGKLGKV